VKGNYAWQFVKLAQNIKKSAPGATEEGIASAARARRELGGSGVVRCMVILYGIEELSVGPELNDFSQFQQERTRRV
jgi:hypothetical protein